LKYISGFENQSLWQRLNVPPMNGRSHFGRFMSRIYFTFTCKLYSSFIKDEFKLLTQFSCLFKHTTEPIKLWNRYTNVRLELGYVLVQWTQGHSNCVVFTPPFHLIRGLLLVKQQINFKIIFFSSSYSKVLYVLLHCIDRETNPSLK